MRIMSDSAVVKDDVKRYIKELDDKFEKKIFKILAITTTISAISFVISIVSLVN